jgi:hypothetical protein
VSGTSKTFQTPQTITPIKFSSEALTFNMTFCPEEALQGITSDLYIKNIGQQSQGAQAHWSLRVTTDKYRKLIRSHDISRLQMNWELFNSYKLFRSVLPMYTVVNAHSACPVQYCSQNLFNSIR